MNAATRIVARVALLGAAGGLAGLAGGAAAIAEATGIAASAERRLLRAATQAFAGAAKLAAEQDRER